MKKTFYFSAILFVMVSFCVISFSSCKKGDTGPQGPAGSNGVANIQTTTVTTNSNAWVLDNTDNSYNYTITVSGITQSVVDKGTVQVFVGDGTGKQWGALPLSYGTVQFNYSFLVGQVEIEITLSSGAVPNNPGGQQFKIVVIPPQ